MPTDALRGILEPSGFAFRIRRNGEPANKRVKTFPNDRKSKRYASLGVLCLFGALLATPVSAQTVVDERQEICEEREVLVWGNQEDVRLYRGKEVEVDVQRGEPIIWFCGRSKLQFECSFSDRVNSLSVSWEKDGRLFFRCLR